MRGDTLEILPAYSDKDSYRISYFGDEVEDITRLNRVTGEVLGKLDSLDIYPAKHYVTEDKRMDKVVQDIELELAERLAYFKNKEMLLEAQRLEQRTLYDLEMMREVGYCSGIENYSRHIDQRAPGTPPWTLLDFLPSRYLLVLDESHQMVPQIRGMYNGDRSRKEVLVEYGFRLPSALDNAHSNSGLAMVPCRLARRPVANRLLIRLWSRHSPHGPIDPQVTVRPIRQIDDLVRAGGSRAAPCDHADCMAEDLAYLTGSD